MSTFLGMCCVIGGILVLVGVLIGLAPLRPSSSSGRGRSFDYNRVHGKYRVLYPDGQLSQPFMYDVACDYRNIFGGSIVPLEYKATNDPTLRQKARKL